MYATIQIQAIDISASPVSDLELAVAEISWMVLSSNENRIILAPARHLVLFPDDTPTSVGIYTDRVDVHYTSVTLSTYSDELLPLNEQLVQWISAYIAEQLAANTARLECLPSQIRLAA